MTAIDTTECRYFITAREPGAKRAKLLAHDGRMTLNRIRAARFTAEQAEAFVAELTADNEGWAFAVLPIAR
jgi:hypothetical protein